jgi:hypothetical protein
VGMPIDAKHVVDHLAARQREALVG